MILDIIFLAIMFASIAWGVKKGIIKTALGLSSFFVSIVVALLLYEPFMGFIGSNVEIAGAIQKIRESITNTVLPIVTIAPGEEIPEFLKYILSEGDLLKKGSEVMATALAEVIIKILIIIVFIILIKLFVTMLFKIFNVTAKLPIIKQANGFVGGLLGVVIGVFFCWIAAAVLTLLMGNESFGWIADGLNKSHFAKYLFDSNLIFTILK